MTQPTPIDLDFRPADYWRPRDPASEILAGIKGELRRRMVRDMLTAEGAQRARNDRVLGEIDSELLGENVDESFTSRMSRMTSFQWMGGEYLPDLARGELEIARITIDSGTLDVRSVRARRAKAGIRYRVVDEYETRYRIAPKTSTEPLSLRELIALIDGIKSMNDVGEDYTDYIRDWQAAGNDPSDPVVFDAERAASARDFVHVGSEVYAQLEEYYGRKAQAWHERWVRKYGGQG